MTVNCLNQICKFNKGGFCSKDHIFLLGPGVCSEWMDRNGNLMQTPFYEIQGEPVATPYQSTPPTEKNEPETDIQENTEISENDESEGKNDEGTTSETT